MKLLQPHSNNSALLHFEALVGRAVISLIVLLLFFVVADYTSLHVHPSHPHISEVNNPLAERFPSGSARHPFPYIGFAGTPRVGPFNDLGYRGALPTTPKNKDEYRIFVVGGSAVFLGEPSLTVALQKHLQAMGMPNATVYNFGVFSSVTGMELARIVHQLVDLEPDLVISYSGGNDVTHPLFWDPRPGYPFNFVVTERNPILEADSHEYPLLTLILYASNIVRLTAPQYFINRFAELDKLRNASGFKSPQWETAIAEKYISNIEKSQRIVEGFGGKWLAFFQPMTVFKKELTATEKQFVQPGVKAHVYRVHELILQQIKLSPPSTQAAFVDFSELFGFETKDAFIDDIHTTAWGADFAASRIAEEVLKQLSVSPTQ